MKNNKFYNFIYDWHAIIMFLFGLFVFALNNYPNTQIITFYLWVTYSIFVLCYIHIDFDIIILLLRKYKKYYLSEEEQVLWKSIEQKINTNTHTIENLVSKEVELIDKIHDYYYGEHWHIIKPISTKKILYIEYNDIKSKIHYKSHS